MRETNGLFIDGEERPSTKQDTFPVLNPMTEAVYGYAARGNEKDVAAAVAAAQIAFPGWAGMPPAEREHIMLHVADLLES
ncbi:MAG: hypothetical protein DHS20C20_09410 [Ardenticatenaceae bacterium]|nr:MAG: hypothetical protein DHS20C20_09410 [Ardenticatenaceae bacterium]